MSRITKAVAEDAATALDRAVNQKRYNELRFAYGTASNRLLDHFYGPEMLAFVESAPEGYFETKDHVSFRHRGENHILAFDGERSFSGPNYGMSYDYTAPEPKRRLPRDHSAVIPVYGPELGSFAYALADKVVEAEEAMTGFKAMIKDQFDTAERTLRGLSTAKRAAAEWPEIVPFLPKYLFDPKVPNTLPAIQRESLNARFGLPIEGAAA